MRLWTISVLLAGLFGCSGQVKLKEAPVSVTGTVSQSGQPVGGMVMVFHPLGDGHVREVPVRRDGTFNGELVSGDYAYFVAKPATVGAPLPRGKLSAKYFEANLSRIVTVEPGKQLAIALE